MSSLTLTKTLGRAAAALVLAAGLAAPAAAAPAKPTDPNGVYYISTAKVAAEYQKTAAYAKLQQKVGAQLKALEDELQLLVKLRYATDDERKEGLALGAKEKRTPAEEARLTELTKKAETLDAEFATLSQKTTPTDDERKRIGELSQMRQDAERRMAKERTDRQAKLNEADQAARQEMEGDLLKLVEKLAKDMKVPVIYDRSAVLFGGTDLTDELLKRLPK